MRYPFFRAGRWFMPSLFRLHSCDGSLTQFMAVPRPLLFYHQRPARSFLVRMARNKHMLLEPVCCRFRSSLLLRPVTAECPLNSGLLANRWNVENGTLTAGTAEAARALGTLLVLGPEVKLETNQRRQPRAFWPAMCPTRLRVLTRYHISVPGLRPPWYLAP